MALKVRSDLHLARRFYHFLGVSVIAYLYKVLPHESALQMAIGFMVLTLLMEFLRFKVPAVNRFFIESFFGPFMRRQEVRNFTGMTYLGVGVFLVILIFPKSVGLLAFLFLAIGDPIASITGILYGRDKLIGQKTLQGAIGGFFACTLVAYFYFTFTELMSDRIIFVSVLGGLIGTISELVPFGKIDDNFTFPVIGASLLWILFQTFGGL